MATAGKDHQGIDEQGLFHRGSTFNTPFDLNLIGLWTLYKREVWRFLKVPGQTIAAPLVTSFLFLLVFAVALGGSGRKVADVPFLVFLAPGLIMMSIIQNAFANTSSSILIAKIQGNIVDVLMPPFRPGELLFGIVAGGVTRGLLVALIVTVVMMLVVGIPLAHPLAALFYMVAGSVLMALLGFLGALWADKFDQMAAITNFVVTPLSFLSGTFYSIEQLPPVFKTIAQANPFFYLIDGLRHAFIDRADGAIVAGVFLLLFINLCLWVLSYRLLRAGYKIKA